MTKKSYKSPTESKPARVVPSSRKASIPVTRENSWGKITPYAALSFVAFACGLVVLVLMLWKQQTLVSLGLVGKTFYIALLPLSFSVAAFLFGVLRSRAIYTGKQWGGVLELGGPIVGAALTVIGGFALPPPDSTAFSLTVFVHYEQAPNEAALRNKGAVTLDLGADRRRESIGEKSQAFFAGIPASFRNQEVLVSLEAEEYELVRPDSRVRLADASVYLPIRRKAGRVTGTVSDVIGNPLAGVAITIDNLSTQSDETGHFEFVIPSEQMKSEFSLRAVATGYTPSRLTITQGKVDIILRRAP